MLYDILIAPFVEFEFMRTTLGPRVDAGEFRPHAPGSREYVAVEFGTLRLRVDASEYTLHKGDSMYYGGDCHHARVRALRFFTVAFAESLLAIRAKINPMMLARTRSPMTPPTSQMVC